MFNRAVTLDLTKHAEGKEVGELTITVRGCTCLLDDLVISVQGHLLDVAKNQKARVRKPCGCGGRK